MLKTVAIADTRTPSFMSFRWWVVVVALIALATVLLFAISVATGCERTAETMGSCAPVVQREIPRPLPGHAPVPRIASDLAIS